MTKIIKYCRLATTYCLHCYMMQNIMPELPEVHTFQRYFDKTSLLQPIETVVVHDAKIIRNISGETFAERLRKRSFTGSYRQGKYLFGDLDNGHAVLLHFGMTGDIKYYNNDADRPKYERFVIHFDNGFRLGFDDPRKFAKIRYLENRNAYIREIGLGEDALRITETAFLERTEGKRSSIKSFLLQQRNLAGVGNLYADEICFQARVHPASVTGSIPIELRRLIFHKMQEILHFAVEQEAYYKDYPDDWLWKWRMPNATAPDGSPAKNAKIGGRTTWFFPAWQVLY